MTSLTVEELVSRLTESSQEDSSAVFEELIKRFEPLLRVTWKRVISRQRIPPVLEYQDFVHDVFVRLFGNIANLRDAKAFPGYFRMIVLSVAYGYLRKPQVEMLGSLDESVETGRLGAALNHAALMTSIDEQILTGIHIRSYLEHLSPREKEIVTLEFFGDLTPKEIGKSLGMRTGAVRATKARAFSKLRQLILRDARLAEKGLK